VNRPKWTKENADERLVRKLPPQEMMPAYKAGWASGWIAATWTLRDMMASEQFHFDEACELVTRFWQIGPSTTTATTWQWRATPQIALKSSVRWNRNSKST
jgi:hypothetical protein